MEAGLVLKGVDLAGLWAEEYGVDVGEVCSDNLEKVSLALWKVLSKVLDRCARGSCWREEVGAGVVATLLSFSTIEEGLGLEFGSLMRLTVPVDKPDNGGGSGETTLTPVVFGERGEAIIVAGSVCRFELEGVSMGG